MPRDSQGRPQNIDKGKGKDPVTPALDSADDDNPLSAKEDGPKVKRKRKEKQPSKLVNIQRASITPKVRWVEFAAHALQRVLTF